MSPHESLERDCVDRCVTECSQIFDRIRVSPTIEFGTRVEWIIHPQFTEPQPHVFQLQVGTTGTQGADDWQDVGLPATDVFFLLDDTQRVFGKTQWTHYRVRLTTPVGIHLSTPQNALGDLSPRFWRLVLNRRRQWLVQFRRSPRGIEGYLLKRKLFGERPELGQGTIDYMTEEITNPQNSETIGTEFVGGYYEPVPCIFADLSNVASHEELDAGKTRGTINDIMVKATLLADPQLHEEDVWVDRGNDHRWYIHSLKNAEEIQGFPVIVDAEFRLAPFTDPIYQIEMPDQLPS